MSDPGTPFLIALTLLIAVPTLVSAALLRPVVMPRTRREPTTAVPRARSVPATPRPMARIASQRPRSG